jgi:hypothetical protein
MTEFVANLVALPGKNICPFRPLRHLDVTDEVDVFDVLDILESQGHFPVDHDGLARSDSGIERIPVVPIVGITKAELQVACILQVGEVDPEREADLSWKSMP